MSQSEKKSSKFVLSDLCGHSPLVWCNSAVKTETFFPQTSPKLCPYDGGTNLFATIASAFVFCPCFSSVSGNAHAHAINHFF